MSINNWASCGSIVGNLRISICTIHTYIYKYKCTDCFTCCVCLFLVWFWHNWQWLVVSQSSSRTFYFSCILFIGILHFDCGNSKRQRVHSFGKHSVVRVGTEKLQPSHTKKSRKHSVESTAHTTHYTPHYVCSQQSPAFTTHTWNGKRKSKKKNNMCCYTYHNCVNHLLTERVLNWAEKYGRLFVKLMIFFYSSTFCVRSYRVVCALYSVENGIRKRQKNMKKKLCSKKTNRGERIDRHDCWSMRHRIERELKKNTHRKEEEKEWIPRDRNRFNVNDHDECIDFFPVVLLFTLSTSNHTHTHSDTKKLPLLRAKQQQQQQKTRLTKGAAARISIRQAIRFYLSISLPLSLIL